MSGETMQGRRVASDDTHETHAFLDEGDYTFHRGEWWCRPPGWPAGPGRLGNHEVVEHDDGTITVSPSILMRRGRSYPEWHGFLERGVWRSV